MKKLTVFTTLIACLILIVNQEAIAKVVVVVNKRSPIQHLTQKTVKRIYLSKIRKIPNTSMIPFPIDQHEQSPVRAMFNSKIIKMSPTQLRTYWSKRIFTGKGGPPKTVHNDNEVKSLVSGNSNMIGYIHENSIDNSIKVVMRMS